MCSWPACVFAQSSADPLTAEGFLTPPKPFADIVLAPRHLNLSYGNSNADRTWFLSMRSSGPTTMAQMARPYATLAGDQFDVTANRDRTLSIRNGVGFVLMGRNGEKKEIGGPKGYRVSGGTWSPSGKKFAFIALDDAGAYLGVADVGTGTAKVVTRHALLPTLSQSLQWTMSEDAVYTVVVPLVRVGSGAKPAVPTQPRVMVSEPTKNRVRPVRGLMETVADQNLLEYLITGQLARIDLKSGKVNAVGQPKMIRSFSVSPDGSAIRVSQVLKPFSYLVGLTGFGSKEEIWSAGAEVLYEITNRPMRAGGAPDPAPTNPNPPTTAPGQGGGRGGQRPATGQAAVGDGRRDIKWRPDGQGISFIQREPAPERQEGDQSPPPRRKDRLMQWSAPYGKNDLKVVYEQDDALASVQYSADCQTIFFTRTANNATELVAVDLATKKATVLNSVRGQEDFYSPSGTLSLSETPSGQSAVTISSDKCVYFRGTQYGRDPEKEAPRPFLDKVSLVDGKRTRIWQSAPDVYESIVEQLDADAKELILLRQSPTMQPDSYRYDTGSKELVKLTQNRDFAPDVSQAQRFRIRVTRPDGIAFWVSVTAPKYWFKGMRLPAMFWFYPSEFVDQAAYDTSKRTYNKNSFHATSVRDMDALVLLGYAVIEPDCPIIGPTDRKNDSYVPDLRNNLSATIDALESAGVIDRSRIGIGGHSYGAFSAVNAMVHTPFFKAGIAGDGAYLRPLTPMAFQSETRTLWEARETYLDMSPLLYAEQLTGALLLYHGLDDLNPGTHPINSERLFNALDGLGKTVSLYMYPYEDHGPAAVETNLDLWARWIPWLEKYVKGDKK